MFNKLLDRFCPLNIFCKVVKRKMQTVWLLWKWSFWQLFSMWLRTIDILFTNVDLPLAWFWHYEEHSEHPEHVFSWRMWRSSILEKLRSFCLSERWVGKLVVLIKTSACWKILEHLRNLSSLSYMNIHWR